MAFLTSQRGIARLMAYAVGVIVIVSFIFWSPISFAPGTTSRRLRSSPSSITNETLGVQKVFVISLPNRLDKRDNIVLGSSVSDFRVEWIDGITPDQIDPKTYPYNWNYDHRPVEYAARRAHINGMQRIISERLGSAIIMEDDADWDVSIKTQLQSFAIAVRALQETATATSTSTATATDTETDTETGTGTETIEKRIQNTSTSPYGNAWDILWLGHCGLECRTDLPSFLTPNDPTILPPHHFLPYWRPPPPQNRPDDARLTCTLSDGVCSIVYAVSHRGAQRILAALSVDPSSLAEKIDTGAQFDVSLGRMCGSGYLRCFASYPSLTGGYRSAGVAGKGSDINGPVGSDGDAGNVEPASSNGVMYSAMLNINRILGGEETVRSAWGDVLVPEVKPDSIPVVGGVIQMPDGV